MKRFYTWLLLGSILLTACEKVDTPKNENFYGGTSENMIDGSSNTLSVLCPEEGQSGPVTYVPEIRDMISLRNDGATDLTPDEEKYCVSFDFGKNPTVTILHAPDGATASLEKVGKKYVPKIVLSKQYDENAAGAYFEFKATYPKENGWTAERTYRLNPKRPHFRVSIPYVHEQDSVLFLQEGIMYERASRLTNSFMDTYHKDFEFKNLWTNTIVRMIAPDWVELSKRQTFTCKTNEGTRREGYVLLTDIYGADTVQVKVIQEGTDFAEREQAVLWEFYQALDGDNWEHAGYHEDWDPAERQFPWASYSRDGHITRIHLTGYNLSGEIPACIGELWHLYELVLDHNKLTGPIPEAIGKLGACDYLNLSYNELTGNLPEALKDMSRLQRLDLNHNKLSGRIPDWFPEGLERWPYQTQYVSVQVCVANNYWTNFSNDKHCTCPTKHHDWDEYNNGFVPGPEVIETF